MNHRHCLSILACAGLAATIACNSGKTSDHKRDDHKRDDHKREVSPATLAKGKATYLTVCAPCHGDMGKGDGPASRIFKPPPRDHTDGTYMNAISDEDLGRVITMGGLVRGKPNMPSNPQLRGEELSAVIAYVRSLSRRHSGDENGSR